MRSNQILVAGGPNARGVDTLAYEERKIEKAIVYTRDGRYGEANDLLKELIVARPNNAELLECYALSTTYNFTTMFIQDDETELVGKCVRKIIEMDASKAYLAEKFAKYKESIEAYKIELREKAEQDKEELVKKEANHKHINRSYRIINQITLTLCAFAIIFGAFAVGYITSYNQGVKAVMLQFMGYDLLPTIAYGLMLIPRSIMKKKRNASANDIIVTRFHITGSEHLLAKYAMPTEGLPVIA